MIILNCILVLYWYLIMGKGEYKLQKALIIYESRYGSTEDIAKKIALIMGPARYCKVENFKEQYKEFDYIVIGCPIYMEQVDKRLVEFISNNREWLKSKKIALFSTSLSAKRGEGYLTEIKDILGENIFYAKALGGKIDKDKLNEKDYKALTSFFNKIGMSLTDIDRSNLDEVIDFSFKIKEKMESEKSIMPEKRLKSFIEEFLISHNTCTLTTGYGKEVRGTPIEYIYKDGELYMFTEGGKKCANILLNPKVSVSVYDSYKSFNELGGMQLSGKAELLDIESNVYEEALHLRGIDSSRLNNMQFTLNVIKIKIDYIEFLNSKFKEVGYDVRQTYSFCR